MFPTLSSLYEQQPTAVEARRSSCSPEICRYRDLASLGATREKGQLTYVHNLDIDKRWCSPRQHLSVAAQTRSFALRDILRILWRFVVCSQDLLT